MSFRLYDENGRKHYRPNQNIDRKTVSEAM